MPDENGSESKAKPKLNAIGLPEVEREQPVDPHQPGRVRGERQDGPGTAPPRSDRTDATPVGDLASRRSGTHQGTGSDDPFAAHRGEPATFATGAARGSGAGAGGGGAGETEEPDSDSASGGGRESH